LYNFNEIAKYILKSDYLLDNETPEDMFMRVSKVIASVEKTEEKREYWTNRFFTTIKEGYWIPATPFLMNAGVNNMFSSCFVVGGLKDDLHSIFAVNERSAIITKMGGGIGLNISKLREKDAYITSTKGKSTGAISFMKVFNTTLDVVMQARRRGAGIIVMDVYHSDIESFITVKSDHGQINNFNISVIVDDAFMNAVKNNQEIELKSPLGYTTKKINAKELFNKIVTNARYHAEPGLLFKSTINKDNPCINVLGEIDSCNACGEIPLYDDEACNLSAHNLQRYIDENGEFDYDKLDYITETIVHFLDNSIDINNFPDEKIREAVLKTRKLGIGPMGVHSMLTLGGLTYDSKEGRKFSKSIMKRITDTAQKYSQKLIEEGRELPEAWYGSKFEEQGIKIRNLSVTSGQPTGATQIIMDRICSASGIEPYFAIAYKRKVRDQEYILVNSLFEEIGYNEGWLNDKVIKKILDNNGSCQGIKEIPKKWQKFPMISLEISWEDHVKMQAELQSVTTNALSKTINMSQNSTIEDVCNAYIMAWELGCKGVTVYVQNSRTEQVLSAENKKLEYELDYIQPISRSILNKTYGTTIDRKSACGKMFITINRDEKGNIVESFVNVGKSGICKSNIDGINRLVSLSLRSGVKVEEIIDQLRGIICPACTKVKAKGEKIDGTSCADIIGRVLEEEYKNVLKIDTENNIQEEMQENEYNGLYKCPECGEYTLIRYDGCINCTNCTWSRCS